MEREYEWDEEKSRTNVAERQLPFSEIGNFDWNTAVIRQSDRYGETRWLATGYIGQRLHVIVFTERGDRLRIISLRTASRRERREYAQT